MKKLFPLLAATVVASALPHPALAQDEYLVLEEVIDEPPPRPHLLVLHFAKSALTVNPCMVSANKFRKNT